MFLLSRLENDWYYGLTTGFAFAFVLFFIFLNSCEGSGDIGALPVTLGILWMVVALICFYDKHTVAAALKSILGYGMGVVIGALGAVVVCFLEGCLIFGW